MKKPIIAFLYDFDLTLSKKDQQEFSFIPSLGLKAKEFWELTNKISVENHMDKILSYLYCMVNESKKKGIKLTKEYLNSMGATVELLPGVEEWFTNINEYGKQKGVQVKHYIISSGLKEIMEGTKIAKYFDAIFGCQFHYDYSGIADFPSHVINYTTKTQYIFRVSKGTLDELDDAQVNKYIEEKDRAVPYENMFYIGDGLTDVPCMNIIRDKGGVAIALYTKGTKSKAYGLLKDQRVDFACPANYTVGQKLDDYVKSCIDKMVIQEKLKKAKLDQMVEAKKEKNEN